MTTRLTVGLSVLMFCAFLFTANAQQQLPPTIYVKVIYYDYHSTGYNPDFQPSGIGCYNGGFVGLPGMIQDTLSPNRKPVYKANLLYNDLINQWWTPSDMGGVANFTYDSATQRWEWPLSNGATPGIVPRPGYPGEYVGAQYNAANTMANVVIYDSLPFSLDNATQTYVYSNQNFFPLDGKGFGSETPTAPNSWCPAWDGNTPNLNGHNFSFSMEIHMDFTYQPGMIFNFAGDDDVFAFINDTLRMDLGGIHNTAPGSINLASLGLLPNHSYKFDFFYCERNIMGSDIKITTNLINPPQIKGIQLVAFPNDTIQAGDCATVTADVYTDSGSGNVLNPSLGSLVKWTKIDDYSNPPHDPGNPALSNDSGGSTTFCGRIAYHSVKIAAMIIDPNKASNILYDTVTIYVEPGPANHIDIEADSAVRDSFSDDPEREILISQGATTAYGYAILRDSLGNYVGLSSPTATNWTSDSPSVATAGGEPAKEWEGVITRAGDSGTTMVTASEGSLTPGTVHVTVAAYFIEKLRLIDLSTGDTVTSINMNTGGHDSLEAIGLKSTVVDPANPQPGDWIVVPVAWSLSPPLQAELPPPTLASQWVYRPADPPDTGTLTLTNADPRTTPLVVPDTITRENPTYAKITLLTPQDSCRAGQPLKFLVQIYNSDGLVPGNFCFTNTTAAAYQDVLDTLGGKQPQPTITTGSGGTTNINYAPVQSDTLEECFANGVDTSTGTLYFAPPDPSRLHQITVLLGNLQASTDPFYLKPDTLDSLALQTENGVPIVGPDTLDFPSGGLFPYAQGYDRYGNPIGAVPSNWSVTGTLHSPEGGDSDLTNTSIIAQYVTQNQSGELCAAAVSNPAKSDCVQLVIIGPQTTLVSAVTRDMNGDGYLDRIDLTFNKAIDFSAGYIDSLALNVQLQSTNMKFTVDSLVKVTDSTWYLFIDENSGDSVLQTSLRPYITMAGTDQFSAVSKFQCADGAGPVILAVVKTVKSDSRSDDIVTVYLSEKVVDSTGGPFNINRRPSSVLAAWGGDSAQTLISDMFTVNTSGGPDSLKDITYFLQSAKDSILTFQMTNGKDLTTADFLNMIAADSTLKDNSGNFVSPLNRKVRVVVVGQSTDIQAGPNPTSPTFNRTQPGYLAFKNVTDAPRWVHDDRAGTVIQLDLSIPGKNKDGVQNGTIFGTMKIYDIVGNLVQATPKTDLLKDGNIPTGVSEYQMSIYWNCSNSNGMKVAPGIYKVVVYLDYTGSGYADTKKYAVIGIMK